MKKIEQGFILIQGLFAYLLIIFILLFTIEMLENMLVSSENQKRSMLAYQILKEEISHMKQGEAVQERTIQAPFQMEITFVNERICVSYEDGNQVPQVVCNP